MVSFAELSASLGISHCLYAVVNLNSDKVLSSVACTEQIIFVTSELGFLLRL